MSICECTNNIFLSNQHPATLFYQAILFTGFVVLIAYQVLLKNPDQNFIYGMLAFPLLELGRMDEAERAARRGLAINKNDFWSHHNVCP